VLVLAELADGVEDIRILATADVAITVVDRGVGEDTSHEGENEEQAEEELHDEGRSCCTVLQAVKMT
jgi:hypothetical protein